MRTFRFISGVVAALAFTTLINCDSNKTPKSSKNCPATSAQALQLDGFHGTSLDPKVLALTFDDGPGVRTKELSAYLKQEGIQAAFFVNGKSMDTIGPRIPSFSRRLSTMGTSSRITRRRILH